MLPTLVNHERTRLRQDRCSLTPSLPLLPAFFLLTPPPHPPLHLQLIFFSFYCHFRLLPPPPPPPPISHTSPLTCQHYIMHNDGLDFLQFIQIKMNTTCTKKLTVVSPDVTLNWYYNIIAEMATENMTECSFKPGLSSWPSIIEYFVFKVQIKSNCTSELSNQIIIVINTRNCMFFCCGYLNLASD